MSDKLVIFGIVRKCDLCFESVVSFPAVNKPMRDIKTGKVIFPSLFPSLLVA